jgi:uncharacterized protein YcfJ
LKVRDGRHRAIACHSFIDGGKAMKVRTASSRSAIALAVGIVAIGVTAAQAQSFTEMAPVLSATPIVQRVSQPRQECWTEHVTTNEVRRLGHIGIGSFDTSTNMVVPVTRDVQNCRTVDSWTDVVQGYDVRYRYQGREYVTRTLTDPGDRIPVDVSIAAGTR